MGRVNSEDELFDGLDGVGECLMMSKCKENIPGVNHVDCLHLCEYLM